MTGYVFLIDTGRSTSLRFVGEQTVARIYGGEFKAYEVAAFDLDIGEIRTWLVEEDVIERWCNSDLFYSVVTRLR